MVPWRLICIIARANSIHVAAREGRAKLARQLLTSGANNNSTDHVSEIFPSQKYNHPYSLLSKTYHNINNYQFGKKRRQVSEKNVENINSQGNGRGPEIQASELPCCGFYVTSEGILGSSECHM